MRGRITADRVRTCDGAAGNSIEFEDGRVVWIGNGDPGPGHVSGTIVPGLRDAHLHTGFYAATMAGVDLRDVSDLTELSSVLSTEARGLPSGVPLVARGLDDERMAERRLPTASELDLVADDRPILLYRTCGHLAIANSPALAVAGIGPATPDPAGGSIDRRDDGTPTGVLRETAIDAVAGRIAPSLPPMRGEDLQRALEDLAGRGLTEVHAMVTPDSSTWCGPQDEVRLMTELDLPLRIRVFAITDRPDALDRVAAETSGGDLLFGGWKGFADGALGARTAALSRPYADTGGTGTPRWDVGDPRATAERALELGGHVAVHAIGDAAVEMVLDLFESLIAAGADPAALRMEHASVIRPDSIERMAGLGVVASVQPSFVRSDGPWIEDRLGPERLGWAHPFRSMADAGIPLLGGSDAPVEIPDPWQAMADARERPYLPKQEALDAERAFSLYVPEGALRPGAPADFLVLDRDPVATRSPEDTQVVARFRGGVRSDR